jgi:DNA mismatch repair protein MutS
MINIEDLHIEEEIIPLFDFTFNLSSGEAVREIITKPLNSISEILQRQNLLKGFLDNGEILKDYSYSRFDLSEVHTFFESLPAGSFFEGSLRWRLRFSEKERHHKRGKLILLILLFNRIDSVYLAKLDMNSFPKEYALELATIRNFFADFNLGHYEAIFRKKKIRVRHIVELMKILTEKVTTGEAASFWKRWFLFEAYLSVSHGIIRHGFTFPTIEEPIFSLEGFYHPLLKNPVRNDLLADKNVLLLTGPNMSGKSTLLKAVSLCVYLGHTGIAVPASRATMPFFNTISVAINLTDSIVSGYSHFMSEIITLKKVLERARGSGKCFAVFDELFRGTNIEDALEISTTTIKGLTRFTESLFIISTHLHQLRDIEEIREKKVDTCYIACSLNQNTPIFTYKLEKGWSDLKLGRILFEKEGLNKLLTKNE